jgi:GTP cyclohydrolase I
MTEVKLSWADLNSYALRACATLPDNAKIVPVDSDIVNHVAALLIATCHKGKSKHIQLTDGLDEDMAFPVCMVSKSDDVLETSTALLDRSDSVSYAYPWGSLILGDCLEHSIRNILVHIGENPDREGLLETPKRVVASYQEIFKGYSQQAEDHLKVFEGESYDEMVLLKGCEFYSNCEHHMQPFFGVAHIAYIPNAIQPKVIGISKLARVLDVFARRLQIQERLTCQVTDALMKHLRPLGAACVIEAKHFCMVCRGVNKQQSTMITSSLQGVFKEDQKVRQEFMALIQK